VVGVEGRVDGALEARGGAGGGPQVVGPAVVFGPRAKEGLPRGAWFVGPGRGGAGVGLGGQGGGALLGLLAPAVQGVAVDAHQEAGADGGALAGLDAGDGLAAALPFRGSTKGSARTLLEGAS
jgi:hypothetical protein